LEAQLDPAPWVIVDASDDTRTTRLETTDNDPVPKDQSPEAAPFDANDYPMIMSIWPDPNQAIQTNVAGKSGQ
jgi:hypothetical protein